MNKSFGYTGGSSLLTFVNVSYGQSTNVTNVSFHEIYEVGLNIWLAISLAITLLGGLLNYLLAATIISQQNLRTAAGILIAHSLTTAGTFLFVSSSIFSIQTFLAQRYPPSLSFCRGAGWLYYVLIQATHWSATPIAFNRFVAVTFPHHYKLITSKLAIVCMISWCWVFAIVCESLPQWELGGIIDAKNGWQSCILRTNGHINQIVALLTASSYLPIGLEGSLYLMMFTIFFTRRHICAGHISPADSFGNPNILVAQRKTVTRRLRVARMLFIGYIVTGSCTLFSPILAVAFPEYVRHPLLLLALRVVLIAGYALNPVVLIAMSPVYREELVVRLKKCCGNLTTVRSDKRIIANPNDTSQF